MDTQNAAQGASAPADPPDGRPINLSKHSLFASIFMALSMVVFMAVWSYWLAGSHALILKSDWPAAESGLAASHKLTKRFVRACGSYKFVRGLQSLLQARSSSKVHSAPMWDNERRSSTFLKPWASVQGDLWLFARHSISRCYLLPTESLYPFCWRVYRSLRERTITHPHKQPAQRCLY